MLKNILKFCYYIYKIVEFQFFYISLFKNLAYSSIFL